VSEPELKAMIREGKGKGAARRLREAGRIPAVVYGHQLKPMSVSVDAKDIEDLTRSMAVESTVINLKIDGGPKRPIKALVREIQRHPFRDQVLHMDFYKISMKEQVNVEVPISIVGTAVGVRLEGGILQHQLREVQVSCLPGEIPDKIEVDVSELLIGDSLHVSDISLGGVEILSDPTVLVATVLPPTIIQEEAKPEVAEEVSAEPELVGEEKTEEKEHEKGGEPGEGK